MSKMKDPSHLKELLNVLRVTQDEECSCEEAHRLLDIYAEAIQRGEDVSEAFRLVRNHLEICRCCRDEFEALMNILKSERGETPV